MKIEDTRTYKAIHGPHGAGVPDHIKDSIARYVERGIRGGSCLDAIFSNNLFRAFGRADLEVRLSMYQIVGFSHNHVPSSCHGSEKAVESWVKLGGANKQQAA